MSCITTGISVILDCLETVQKGAHNGADYMEANGVDLRCFHKAERFLLNRV